MGLILSIETTTKTCSVALANDAILVSTKEITTENFSHSENLNPFIEELIDNSDFSLSDLDAIAVSEGPGSYTGLRIGTSTAKGLCYGLDIPLIALSSLKALANLTSINSESIICPMFDARRMEVYTALYNKNLEEVEPVSASVIDEFSYQELLDKNAILFIGPGAEKCQDIIVHKNASFDLETIVSARGMVTLAEEKFKSKDFKDLAYFEPFYLKDFIAGKPKKLL